MANRYYSSEEFLAALDAPRDRANSGSRTWASAQSAPTPTVRPRLRPIYFGLAKQDGLMAQSLVAGPRPDMLTWPLGGGSPGTGDG